MNTDFLNKRELPLDSMMPIIIEHLANGNSVCISPKGISMLPMLRDSIDSVVLAPLPDRLKKYDIPLYKRENGKYILHRIVKIDDTYTCIGDNQFKYEKGIERAQLIAVVTAFTHGNKEYSVNDFSYKFYCRFWHYSRSIRRVYRALKRRFIAVFKE